jgi:hypothetical protein
LAHWYRHIEPRSHRQCGPQINISLAKRGFFFRF